jgi:D-sedoheptulose 7-phosphate isomerase
MLKQPESLQFLELFSHLLKKTFHEGKKVLIAGNGGSLCDAAHFAEELTGFFREKRRAFPVIVLSEPGHLTCVANDIGYDHVFQRGVEAFGSSGDLFIALSTSGNSPNLILAMEEAKKRGLKTVSFLGKAGGLMKGKADLELWVQGFSTSDRIQEAHMAALHIAIELFEILWVKEGYDIKASS